MNQNVQSAFENQIIMNQLSFIVQKLNELYPTNEEVQFHLKNAVELLQQGNLDLSADTLHVN